MNIAGKIMKFLGGVILGTISGILLAYGTMIFEDGCAACPQYLLPDGRKTLVLGSFFIYQGIMFVVAYRHEHSSWFFGILMSLARNVSPSGEHKPHEMKYLAVERDGELVFPDENALGWAFISLWGGIGSVAYAYLGFNIWFFLITILITPIATWQIVTRFRKPKKSD
jgi:hypothetical protein